MAHPLEQKIGEVRRRARTLLIAYGLCAVVGTLLVSMMVVGLADYFIHFRDRGVRAICLLAVLGATAWVAYRYLLTALRSQLRDVDVALRIERRFPAFQDRLASTVEFLKQPEDDPRAGSPLLRRTVIAQTTAEAERLKLSDAIDARPAWRALGVAGAIVAVLVLLAVLDPLSVRLAIARLVQPFGGPAWPKANHLAYKNPPQRIALGQAFELEVVDDWKARLPDEVRLYFRYQDDTQTVENMHFRNGVMVFRKEQIERPFAYRAEGGDDDSLDWINLQVVEPPLVERMDVKLHFPEYTGWEPKSAESHLRALVGTRVEIDATTTKQIRAATLSIENGPKIPAIVKPDGYGFLLPVKAAGDKSEAPEFKIEKSGAYTFDLEDMEGFHGAREIRYEIRAVEDRAPTVSLDEPPSNIFVTADASVPFKIAAKDDLAIHEITLHHSRSDKSEEGETKLVLFAGPPKMEQSAASKGKTEIDAGDNRTVEHMWDLAPLGLKPGVQITVFATATDYRPLIGQSHPRRLTIISRQEQEERVAERQTLILGELARVLKLQRESREHLTGLQIQMEKVGQLSKQDIDHLQGAELTQRQVERGLTSKTEGVPMQIEGLLADLRNNNVDSPEVERRMTAIKTEIQRLGKDHLPAIDREMTGSLKASQDRLRDATGGDKKPPEQDSASGKKIAESLNTATGHQDEVIKTLEQMLGDLSQWDNYRRFHREIGQLRLDQEEIARDTAEIGRKTLTKNVKELEPQQQADLEKLGARQNDLGRRFDKIQQRMQQMAGELKETDPLAAGTLSDALHEAQKQALGGQMRQAGRNVEKNQIGQAGQLQQQSSKNLQELLDILSNRRERELAGLVKKLREAEQELAGLNKRQEGLRKKMEEAAKNPNEEQRRQELQRLAREQKQLQEEVERFARRLQRLQADKAARSAAKGGGKMGQAGQQGEQGNAQGAEEQAAAAKKDLDDAQQQLAEQRKQAEIDLAMEQLARMEDGIKSMVARQSKVLEETKHYEKLRTDQGRWTRPQLTGLQDLARQQTALQDETSELEKKLSGVGAFQLVLKGAGGDMARAAALLDQRQAGEPTQRAESNSLRRFEQLLAALKKDGKDGESEQGAGQGGGQQQGGETTGTLAELKLMKLMQEELNSRTRALEETLAKTRQLTSEQQEEYIALGQEQGKLADLLLELTKSMSDKMKDDPTQAPLPLDDEGENSKQNPKGGRRLPLDLNEELKP